MSSSPARIDKARSEAFYVSRLVQTLATNGYKARCEVPNLSQSVDIVATKGRWVYAIEVKLFNWRVALHQCGSHEVFADFICIAITTKTIAPDLLAAVEARGYGLLRYDHDKNDFVWFRRPRQNKSYWSHHRRLWAKTLQEIDYAY